MVSQSHPRLHALVASSLLAAAPALSALPPTPDHIVIVIEENHSFTQVMGYAGAPFINGLAAGGANFTSFYAITHPSQPNYIEWFSGSNQGVTNNTSPPPGAPFTTPNLGAELLLAGKTFTAYSEDLPAEGSTVASSGAYVRRHCPWVNWQTPPAAPGPNQIPAALNKPFSAFPSDFSTLPDVAIVIPNQNNNMHDGTIEAADAWLAANIQPYAEWCQSNNSLLIITWDEDESASRNRIPTIFYGPMVKPGTIVPSTWTLHNLSRTIEDMHTTTYAGSMSRVQPIVGPFRMDHRTTTRTFRHGVDSHSAVDTYVEPANPTTSRSVANPVVVDTSPLSQGLIRFESIIGPTPDQVPANATILSAKLMILTGAATSDNSGTTVSAHRMISNWSAASTWNSLGAGITPNDSEAATTPDFTVLPNILNAWAIFDVTATVQMWSDGAAPIEGWALVPAGTDGWRFVSSESATPADRPILEITYDLGPPCPTDWDDSGTQTITDIFAFLSSWFAGLSSADWNENGTGDIGDIFAFLAEWFVPCP